MDINTSGGGDHHTKKITKKSSKRKSKNVKVVYISSPMKVKTSASKFRALVQELTGQHSDVSRFMEFNVNPTTHQLGFSSFNHDYDDHVSVAPPNPMAMAMAMAMEEPDVRDDQSPSSTSIDSFPQPSDDLLSSSDYMEHHYFSELFSF